MKSNGRPPNCQPQSVAIGGLGALGLAVARALDQDSSPFELVAVAARDADKAARSLADFRHPPAIVNARQLADADIVIEAATPAAFRDIVEPAVKRARTVIIASAATLLSHFDLAERAHITGAAIVVPTGSLAGLDAIRAISLTRVESITLETRKPPASLAGAPHLASLKFDVSALDTATLVFSGSAREAARGFPANANVAAALALAGIGADRTRVEIWADPNIERNVHIVRAESSAARLTFTIEAHPSPSNPRTSQLAPLSVLACLNRLRGTLLVGT